MSHTSEEDLGQATKLCTANSGTVVEKADTEWAPGPSSMGGSTIHADGNKAGQLAQCQGAAITFTFRSTSPQLLQKNRALGMLH